jgi:hypothetical protein
MLEAAGVDLVLGGHIHYYARSYPLHGAYGPASTNAAHILDLGDGRPGGSGAYTRPLRGPGTVYLVSGGASSVVPPEVLGHHPVMYTEQVIPGSVIIDVDGLRLDSHFIDHRRRADSFTIVKTGAGPSGCHPPTAPTALVATRSARADRLAWAAAIDGERASRGTWSTGQDAGGGLRTTSFQDMGSARGLRTRSPGERGRRSARGARVAARDAGRTRPALAVTLA